MLELMQQCNAKGHTPFLVAGVPEDFSMEQNSIADLLAPDNCMFVRFESADLHFKVVGMSNVMPYPSTVCGDLNPEEIAAYIAAFERVVARAVEQFAPDVIHTNHLWMATAAAKRAAPNTPLVATCHGTCLRQHNLCPELSRSLLDDLGKVDRVIALFERQKQEIQELLHLPKERITTISGGFNQEYFYTTSESPQKTSQEPVHILYAGKLNQAKGVPWLLHSLQRLEDLPLHLHLVGGGSGPEKEHCLQLAAQLNHKPDGDNGAPHPEHPIGPKAPRVTVHGVLSHHDLGELMRRSQIFVLPSFFEGLPLVLLEALACGCRIITTDLPGARELFSSHSGQMKGIEDLVRMIPLPPLQTIDTPHPEDMPLLKQRLATALAETIRTAQTNGKPPKRRPDEALIKRLTAPYTWDKIFQRVEAVYEQAVIV